MRTWSACRPAVAAWLLLVSLGAFASVPSLARAQTVAGGERADGTEEVALIIEQGRKLESERRWADALTYYERAARQHPASRALQDRLTLAKAHFDIGRRYADASFVEAARTLSERESLDVYTEILGKIQAHYVQPPNWHDLLRQGTFHLEVALTEPVYLHRNVPGVSADDINACRREIRELTDTRAPRTREEARQILVWAARIGQQRIGLSPSALCLEYVCGAMNSLDDYSSFLTGDQLSEVFSQIEGNFVGLGIELKSENGELVIVSVISGSPAGKAGLVRGDRIIAVDGRSTRDASADTAADMLKGPEGSAVSIELIRNGAAPRIMRLSRERIEVPSVEDVRIVDQATATGYFKLTSFQKTTSRDVDTALWNLHRQGMRNLIIDVRGNPGGLLTAAVDVADKFLTHGTIVMTRGRSANEDYDYKAHGQGTWRVPLYVLVDGDSASASEIFAGAIHDHQRGLIVGTKSYGKGSVQGIFPLASSNAGVRLTTAKFYSPSGQEINKRGVEPNLLVRATAKPVVTETSGGATLPVAEDAVLRAAIEAVRGR